MSELTHEDLLALQSQAYDPSAEQEAPAGAVADQELAAYACRDDHLAVIDESDVVDAVLTLYGGPDCVIDGTSIRQVLDGQDQQPSVAATAVLRAIRDGDSAKFSRASCLIEAILIGVFTPTSADSPRLRLSAEVAIREIHARRMCAIRALREPDPAYVAAVLRMKPDYDQRLEDGLEWFRRMDPTALEAAIEEYRRGRQPT